MREGRPAYADLTPEERRKAIARGKANVAVSRGKLARQPCSKCGSPKSEKHHPNYAEPLDVVWLCRGCHDAEHGES
jgi:hypothetical protein